MRAFKILLASGAALFAGAAGALPPVHQFLTVALSPDGSRVASVEGDETPAGDVDVQTLLIRATSGGARFDVTLPCGAAPECTPSDLAWSPDGKTLAFVLRSPGSHAHAIYATGANGGVPRQLASFDGTLVGLRYGPAGQLSVLATAGAEKEVGAVEAGAAIAGELGADVHEQRIAILQPDGSLRFASPADLFVYEYDWRPDGAGFVGTAAPGDGDNNWWVAKLYTFDAATAGGKIIYAPVSASQQLAGPVVSPDGKNVAFIGGLMSDFGATGGDVFLLPLDKAGAKPVDMTPKLAASVDKLAWDCGSQALVAGEFAGDAWRLARLVPGKPAQTLAATQEWLGGGPTPFSAACATGLDAVVHSGFTTPPEIEVGKPGAWHDLTQANVGLTAPATVRSVTWQNDGFTVQGWLLQPLAGAKSQVKNGKLPLITEVHGGPAWANWPRFIGLGDQRSLLEAGYGIFLPNPRGSYGQGEAFTQANRHDFGHGDLRDILTGITAVEKIVPVDEARLGIMGWSYGGYMTMWAVTQTHRFKAAVAGAGLSDWLSYYGENGIDAWMIPYFGASVYDDPAVYAKSSPMNFIKNVRTPTLSVVGANDIECPAPQTEEFWHGLHDLGVPAVAVIYPGEGHHMRKTADIADFHQRLVAWFDKYLG